MKLLSLQIGLPRTHGQADAADPMDREWTSAFFKDPVHYPIHAGAEGLDGDGVADRRVHGGADKAINAYPADHFPTWREELGVEFSGGAFGENFTTHGLLETEACIGDIFQIGGITVQISQPRQPCWKLARRWKIKDLASRVEQTGRTGWYFRVLTNGLVSAPADFVLIERPYPRWTIAEANDIMHHRKTDWAAARELADCPALSTSWKTGLTARAEMQFIASTTKRLNGTD